MNNSLHVWYFVFMNVGICVSRYTCKKKRQLICQLHPENFRSRGKIPIISVSLLVTCLHYTFPGRTQGKRTTWTMTREDKTHAPWWYWHRKCIQGGWNELINFLPLFPPWSVLSRCFSWHSTWFQKKTTFTLELTPLIYADSSIQNPITAY